MARDRSPSMEAVDKTKEPKDSKEGIKSSNKVSSSSNSKRGRERDRRHRGSASTSSDSSDSSSDSSSSSRSSDSGSRSSSSSSSGSSSSTSSSSSRKSASRTQSRSPPPKRRERSRSPPPKRRDRTPIKQRERTHSRTRSPQIKNRNRSRTRSRSPAAKRRDRSRSLDGKPARERSRSRSRSPAARGRERSPTPKPTRIHIGRLTRNVNKEHVAEIFSCFGEVKNVEFPTDRFHPSFGRGIAYVEYATHEECEMAIKQMDGGQIDGQEVSVSAVLTPKMRPVPRRPSPINRRMDRWRSPPRFNRFNRNRRSPLRGRGHTPRRRSRSPVRRRRRSNSSDSSH